MNAKIIDIAIYVLGFYCKLRTTFPDKRSARLNQNIKLKTRLRIIEFNLNYWFVSYKKFYLVNKSIFGK